ncbi:uncharacterized protein LOC133869558 [Alnus glutinosa]|uniref:uncharacterized protein LOC133869558 n=1 Tax=Alnus glutinosa TaxID=3517 RepID=UPI002D799196|nr:uncharacterized protein LOC133869558 [Alnus glutinosa]
MNFLLASDKENTEKRVEIHSCFYCKKVFNNYQALGGHLRAHQEGINVRRSWNYPVHSSNFLDVSSTAPNPILMGQPENSSGGAGNNPSSLFSRATSSMDFSKFCSNESACVNGSNYVENNVGNATSKYIMSPNLSSSSGRAEVHHSNPLTSSLFIPSASTATTGFPMGSSLYSSPYGICQFNTDELRTFRDGTPFSSRDALPNFQHHNLSDGQCSGQNGVDKYNESSMLTCEGGKKRCLDEVLGNSDMMNSSKRPQISSNLPAETEKPQKKELLLFKDVEDSFTVLGISFDDKTEDEADLDLSLHL